MSALLRELELLVLDCQAGGATPAHGDLLELGWARCTATGELGSVWSRWIVPRTTRRVGRAVRELTGWSEAEMVHAVSEREAWHALSEDVAELERGRVRPVPVAIHFARFEVPFLRDLHERLGEGGDFPLDVVCLHAVAERVFPDLPRRNIRALAGYLGHSPELVRRSAGHVTATAFIWQALLPRLETAGVQSWLDLKQWLAERPTKTRSKQRVFPLPSEHRRALPDAPGVYRFARSNGDILYVGKATSLKKRVAGHFKSRGPATERSLELLTQVHGIVHTQTPTLLEAALLECDEIKRLDPPYNVQLRSEERRAWFASRDLRAAAPAPNHEHTVGPLPSRRALAPLAALIALTGGAEPTPEVRAEALAVPVVFVPDPDLFARGWREFAAEHLTRELPPRRRVLEASSALWLLRGRTEEPGEESPQNEWDLARVRRRLERSLVQTGLLVRRARCLALLTDATVAFRECASASARLLVFAAGQIVEQRDLESVAWLAECTRGSVPSLIERQRCFEVASYDRLRVLVTELCRVQDEGGEIAVHLGRHSLHGERLAQVMRSI